MQRMDAWRQIAAAVTALAEVYGELRAALARYKNGVS